jgi:2-oxoglutarate ferredoxin oxidoreductase subunit alpha
MWYTGDEHDEYGHITEEPETRTAMVRKRFAKLDKAACEIPELGVRATLYPENTVPSSLDVLVYSWGSAAYTAAEVVDIMRKRGVNAALLRIHYFSPYPAGIVARIIAEARQGGARIVAVEHNYKSQAALLARMYAGVDFDAYVLKYTGRPIYVDELLDALIKINSGEVVEVHLSRGA